MNSSLFSEGTIKNMHLKNRLVRSATFEGMATFEGRPTRNLKKLYYRLAEGEVGLIVTGLTHVDGYKNLPNIEGAPFPLAMDEDRFIDDWQEVIEKVHERGAKIAMQLIHLGRQDIPALREPIAPSAVPLEGGDVTPREMTLDEIHDLIEKFAQSCGRVKKAGFDAVQLHAGHGYLISNFISPFYNRRTDEYGGDAENRARFILEILEKARELVGPDFPILIKMNFDDFMDGGLDGDEAIEIAERIVQAGIDAVEVTGGISSVEPMRISAEGIDTEDKEAYFRSYAKALKTHVSAPVILVGGLRTPRVMDELLNDGTADFLSMCRPLICEPGLIRRWMDGDVARAKCISCNKCRDNAVERPLRCYIEQVQ